jgi:hypothetical protein
VIHSLLLLLIFFRIQEVIKAGRIAGAGEEAQLGLFQVGVRKLQVGIVATGRTCHKQQRQWH